MADERCVYENVLRDASSICVDIFRKLPAILMETSEHSNLHAGPIFGTVVQLFRWIALGGELHVRNVSDLKTGISEVVENRACEHGARYKGLVKIDDFWDEKQWVHLPAVNVHVSMSSTFRDVCSDGTRRAGTRT